MSEENVIICAHCGCIIEDGDGYVTCSSDGKHYCEDCAEEFLVRCNECEEYFLPDDVAWIWDSPVCNDCKDEFYYQCDFCGTWYHIDDTYYVNGDRVCEDCYNDNFYTCESCGCDVYRDDACWYDDYVYCDHCYEEMGGDIINDYGYKPDPIFSNMGESDPLYMGFELEVDNGHDRSEFAEIITDMFHTQHNEDNLIYCKNDGSLNDGFEIVTHPSTLDYYKNVKIFEKINEVNREEEFGFHSDQTSTCGFHVHVSRAFFHPTDRDIQNLHIAKIIILVNRFWEGYIQNFSRRRGDYHWCGLNTIASLVEGEDESIIAKKCTNGSGTRYVAVNLENRNTIEFRIFKGTLNPVTAYANLEFVDRICRYAKSKSLAKVLSATWNDVFGDRVLNMCANKPYQELIEYCHIRNIYGENARGLETKIRMIKPVTGFHYVGEVLKFKPWEEIVNIFSKKDDVCCSYDSEGNLQRMSIPSIEGRTDEFDVQSLLKLNSEYNNWEISGFGDRVNIRNSSYDYRWFSMLVSRDILETMIAA